MENNERILDVKKKITIIHGADVSGVYVYKRALARSEVDLTVEQFTENVDTDLVLHVINTQNLFFSKCRLEFFNPVFFLGKTRSNIDQLVQTLSQLPEGMEVMFIVEGKIDERLTAWKKLAKHANIYESKWIDKREILPLIERILKGMQYQLSTGARDYLIEYTDMLESTSVGFWTTECEKWCLMEQGKSISAQTVRDSLPTYINKSVFEFWNTLIKKDKNNILDMNESMFEDVKSGVFHIAYIQSQLRNGIILAECAAKGVDVQHFAKQLKIHPFRAQRLLRDINTIGIRKARLLIQTIYNIQVAQRTSKTDVRYLNVWLSYL